MSRAWWLLPLTTLGVLAGGCTGTGESGTPDGAPQDGGSSAACGNTNAAALRECVDQASYAQDLEFIAAPRPPGSPHWQAVQDLCAERLTQLGYDVERQEYGSGVNVLGTLAGTSADPRVIVSAHYEHIENCAGADDNASGVAGVLETARVLATGAYAGTLVVACWDEEERGLVGSDAFAAQMGASGASVSVAFVYEMIGYRDPAPNSQTLPDGIDLLFPAEAAAVAANDYRGDFVAVVADDSASAPAHAFEQHATATGLPAIVLEVPTELKNSALLSDLRRSDHASFWQQDMPAVMLTDTAEFRNPYYHCTGGDDVVSVLDHAFAASIIRGVVGAAAQTLQVR